jgi:hypothetical protein
MELITLCYILKQLRNYSFAMIVDWIVFCILKIGINYATPKAKLFS